MKILLYSIALMMCLLPSLTGAQTFANELNDEISCMEQPAEEDGMYGLGYAEFVIPLVKTVQAQQDRIVAQEEMISTLIQQNEQSQLEIRMIKTELQKVNDRLSNSKPSTAISKPPAIIELPHWYYLEKN